MILSRPPFPVLLLVGVALLDLVATTALFSLGMIEEMNPLMRPLLHAHPVIFVVVKLATIVIAFVGLQWYRRYDDRFVRIAAGLGAIVYSVVWIGWCVGVHL